MAWLVSGARVLASAEVAEGRGARRRGLLGRRTFDGALVIDRCKWVHTIGMKFAIDVAYLDPDGAVIKVEHLKAHRVGARVKSSTTVVEAEAGAFERWGLRVGDVIEVRLSGADDNPGAP